MHIVSPKPAASESEINYKDANSSYVQFGSVSHSVNQKNMNKEDITLDYSNTSQVCPIFEKSLENIPKPRTALFQGGEDDEPMEPQIIDTENYYVNSNKSIGEFPKFSGIQFGAFALVEKYIKRNKGLCASTVPPSSILSIGANLRQKQEMKHRRFIHIGSVAVEINEA